MPRKKYIEKTYQKETDKRNRCQQNAKTSKCQEKDPPRKEMRREREMSRDGDVKRGVKRENDMPKGQKNKREKMSGNKDRETKK